MESSAWVNACCKKLERQGERTARLKEAQAGPRKGSHTGRSSEPIELLVAHGLILIGPQPLLAFWRQNPDSALPPSLLLKSVPFTLTCLFLEKTLWWTPTIISLVFWLAPCSAGLQRKSYPSTYSQTWTQPKVDCSAPHVHSGIVQGHTRG